MIKALTLAIALAMPTANACTGNEWSGFQPVVSADSPLAAVPRVAGFCAGKITGSGWFSTDTPTADTKILARFYFYPGAGTYKIFTADNVTELFSISYDNGWIGLDASSAGGGAVGTTAIPDAWNVIQFIWESANDGSLWVNTDATIDPPDATFYSGVGAVEDIRLGVIEGTTSEAFFDDIKIHRRTVVGPILMGDANADASVNSGDIISVANEFFGAALSEGTPDCNLDGQVNSGDIICIINTFFAS